MYIFVYGTLCRGLSRNQILNTSQYLGLAFCKGSLIDLGSYPGMVPSEERVVGEVYNINPDQILQRLDDIEGYVGKDTQCSLYLRKKVSIQLLSTGKYVEASTYIYNQSTDKYCVVPVGDYRRYLLDHESGPAYYLAFGSNLNTARLKSRIGDWHKAIKGVLPGFCLIYNKLPDNDRGDAYANIIAGVLGKDCPCVAYLIDRACFKKLDQLEGVPNHYIRSVLTMKTVTDELIMGYTYIAHPNYIVYGRFASDQYRDHLLKGYKEHDLGDLEKYETAVTKED